MDSGLLDITEAAEFLGTSRRTLFRRMKSGDGPRPMRFSRRDVRFDVSELMHYAESRRF
jgi:predicted DNA-binding transcriptional regulator AlpA